MGGGRHLVNRAHALDALAIRLLLGDHRKLELLRRERRNLPLFRAPPLTRKQRRGRGHRVRGRSELSPRLALPVRRRPLSFGKRPCVIVANLRGAGTP